MKVAIALGTPAPWLVLWVGVDVIHVSNPDGIARSARVEANAKTGHHVLLLLLLHQCIKKLEVHTQIHWRRVVSALGDRRCPLLLEFGMSMPMLPASHEESDGIAVVVKADVPCMS
jgi:hypothetical protein